MANISTKIKLYCKANDVSNVDFTSDVIIQNDSDGKGAYIKEWNLDITQPTDEQLATYETNANTEEALQTVLNNRAKEYPSIADQLDDIYHNGIDGWKATIKTTKDKYPKE
ncbi:phage protein XkdW-like protein [uncultured Mediterranean phage uvMED]|nr:phage protein XkdW-like protein [uncultured Mediterranean phage uvMED]BAR14155.1 phage protein XkdW-like protein [uncultured Mediterranean phage uvMED]BAR15999.1 phage protein XkdW-like protein [uncultured Mediterranean phage uvMED]BAR37276.1 phage protein XkdW-like protein [uncultured Mediterranean phage uvMED]